MVWRYLERSVNEWWRFLTPLTKTSEICCIFNSVCSAEKKASLQFNCNIIALGSLDYCIKLNIEAIHLYTFTHTRTQAVHMVVSGVKHSSKGPAAYLTRSGCPAKLFITAQHLLMLKHLLILKDFSTIKHSNTSLRSNTSWCSNIS